MEANTNIIITCRAGSRVKAYRITAGEFCRVMWDTDCDGMLPADYSELPLSERLSEALKREAEAYGGTCSYTIV